MKNPLTFRVESSLGAIFMSLLSLFFIGLLFIAVKNLESDIDVLDASHGSIKTAKISQGELILIREWVSVNDIEIPEGLGYKYLIRKYPSKPWLDE